MTLTKTLWKYDILLKHLLNPARLIISTILFIAVSLGGHSEPHFKKVPLLADNRHPRKALKLDNIADTIIRGRVTDSSGSPIAGVSVLVKGSKNGTFTSTSGDFTLRDVAPRATLVISNVGYQSTEVKLSAGQTTVAVSLYREAGTLAEVVITGFQQIDKKKFTGAAVTLKAEDIKVE